MVTITDEQSKFEENLDLKGWKRVSNSGSPLNLKIKIKTSFKSWGETLFINTLDPILIKVLERS